MTCSALSIRLPDDLLERVDRLGKLMSERAAGAQVTRSAVLRLALERGVSALEDELRGRRRRKS